MLGFSQQILISVPFLCSNISICIFIAEYLKHEPEGRLINHKTYGLLVKQ